MNLRTGFIPAGAAFCFLFEIAVAFAADAPKGSRTLVDFADAKAIKLNGLQAEFSLVPLDRGRGMQITTEAAAQYPSVQIEPAAGKWDLTGFEAVEMDLRNSQDAAVRVLLSVNNPGADGRNHCNVESVTVGPHDKATLTVPFGSWHGNLNHPLDFANIVSLSVLLDKPGRSHTFTVGQIRAVRFDESKFSELAAEPFFKKLSNQFGRGVNLGNALEAPREGDWGVKLKEEYFEAIAKAGFDSVRIPVRWSAHAADAAPYTIDSKFFDRVDWAVEQALKRRLTVVLNMHHYDGMMDEPAKHRERFVGLWKQIAEHYKDRPASLALELLNEPHNKLTADEWNRDLAAALAAVRQSNPTRDVVVGPIGWNGIGELGSLKLPESDRHLIVTVHYYNPFHFTHQGADFVPGAKDWLGQKWSGSKTEQQAITRDFDKALAWAIAHERSLYLGEFGSYQKADMESRARWTRFIADEALMRKMSFAYWEFCSGFGTYDPQKNEWIEPIERALLAPK